MGSQDSRQGRGHAAVGYAVLIVYGSLYPFSGWFDARDPFAFLFYGWSATYVSPGDLATNVLAYVPLGLLVHRFLLTKAWGGAAAAFTVAAAFLLSLSMELLQAYLPTRTQSEFDLLMNTLGGALGVIAASLPGQRRRIVDMLRQARSNWFVPGRLADLGLIALAAWLLSRLMPLVTSLEVGKFQAALAPLSLAIADPRSFNGWQAFAETLSWAGIGLVAKSLVRPGKPAFAAIAIVSVVLLVAQIPILGRQLTPEVLVGCGAGLLLARLLANANASTLAKMAFLLVFAGFCVAENVASNVGMLHPFNWIPFSSRLDNIVGGIGSLLEMIGLSAVLAWCARSGADQHTARRVGWSAGLLVTVGAFALEFGQRHVPGRIGDITVPLLIAFTWILAWRSAGLDDLTGSPQAPDATPAAEPSVGAWTKEGA
jgi:VanZ family protein